MDCELCPCNVDSNKEVFTAINQLILEHGYEPVLYNDLVIRLCENAGCSTEIT